MPIRMWSLTRFWAVTVAIWGLALVLADSLGTDYGGRVNPWIAMMYIPAFLAGAWAAVHPEIREWLPIRVIAMWGFALTGIVAVNEMLRGTTFSATVVGAPVAVLTIRWVELSGVRLGRFGRLLRREPGTAAIGNSPIPATTPSSGTPII